VHDARDLELLPLCGRLSPPVAAPPLPRRQSAAAPPLPAPAERTAWEAVGIYLLRLVLATAGISGTAYAYQMLLAAPGQGHYAFHFPVRYAAYGAVLLTTASLLSRQPAWMMAAISLTCLHHLYETCPALVPYVCLLLPALYWLLGRERQPGRWESARFWLGVLVGIVALPKVVQDKFGLDHGSFLDLNQNLFAGLFLRYAYYYYERRRGFVPAGGFWEHCAYLLFIPQITGMLNLPPSEMAARWGFGAAGFWRGFAGLGRAAWKIPAILYLQAAVLPGGGYARGYEALRAESVGALWLCLLLSYLHWYLLISTKFDLMTSLFRFFGVDVDDNFRWPLLATSPVALWRRWNLYNRRLLLKFVYFPMGSALLVHTGFLGSPWLWVDPAPLRDWVLYFAAQGALVCAAYWWLQRPFWEKLSAGWRWPLRAAGWAFTLASSAWLHILPLAAGNLLNADAAPIPEFTERLALMLRALGVLWRGGA
jgi:hypothetical protein